MARAMKDSGIEWIGEIPEGWKADSLKRHFSIISGATPKSENSAFWDGDIPWITPADFKTSDKFVSHGKRNLTRAGYDSCGTSLIPKGSIVFSKRAPVGTVAIANNELCTNQGCLSCVVKDHSVPSFYYYAMSVFTEQFELVSTGTTFKEIAADVFANFRLPAPSTVDQQKIADYLDTKCAQIDAVIEQTRASIEEYKKLKQSVITQAVTKGIRPGRRMKDSGVEWIGEIPEDWKLLSLGAVTESMRNGYVGPTKDLFIDEGVKYIQSLHIKDGGIDFSRQQYYVSEEWANVHPKIKENDVLIVQTGDIGNVGLVTAEYDGCNCHALIIATPRTDLILPQYLTFFLRSTVGKELLLVYKTGALLPHLNSGKIKFASICVPSLQEQKEIVNYLNAKSIAIDNLILKKELLASELESYKKSLIFEYVTGKKEVPHQQETLSINFIDMRALLMCRIIELMKPKGRIHLLKALYAIDCLSGLNNQTQYVRYTHGPYDTRIGEYETAMAKHGWAFSNRGAAVEYRRGKSFAEYRELYQRCFRDLDPLVRKICFFLKPMKTSQAERVATLLAVWNDFLLDGATPTDNEIVQEVRSHWTPNKAHSEEATWFDTLRKIKENNLAPRGIGLHTAPKTEKYRRDMS